MQGFLKEHVNQAGSWNKDFNFTTHLIIINEPPPPGKNSKVHGSPYPPRPHRGTCHQRLQISRTVLHLLGQYKCQWLSQRNNSRQRESWQAVPFWLTFQKWVALQSHLSAKQNKTLLKLESNLLTCMKQVQFQCLFFPIASKTKTCCMGLIITIFTADLTFFLIQILKVKPGS